MTGLACLASAAPTADVTAQVRVAGSGRLVGTWDLEGELAGLTYTSTSRPPSFDLNLTFNETQVRVISAPYSVVGSRPGNPNPGQTDASLPREELVNQTGSGLLRLVTPGANATLAVLPRTHEGTLAYHQDGQDKLTFEPRSNWQPRERSSFWGDARLNHPVGHGAALRAAMASMSVAAGPTFAFLFGGTYVLELGGAPPRTIVTGERLNESRSVSDPSGQYGTWWFDRTVILVLGDDVRTQAAQGGNALELAVRTMRGTLVGDLALSNVTGSVRVGEASTEPQPELLQAIGTFDVAADYGGEGGGRWTLAGPATFVGIDGLAIVGDRLAHKWPAAAVVVGAAGLAAVAAAFLTHLGREMLTFVTGRNVAKPLESETRLLFLQEIARQPGLSLRDLANRAGITKWGAMHHVAVLKRAHYVDEVRRGNTSTFMLNSHSYRFRVPETGVSVGNALAELGHPTRRLLHETLTRIGSAHYAQLVSAWQAANVPPPHPSPSDVTYHGSKMEQAGLLRRRREGPHVMWEPNLDLARVRQHQVRAWLQNPIAGAVFDAVGRRPGATEREIARALTGTRRPLEAVRQVLPPLVAAGLLVPSEGGYRVAENAPIKA